MYIHITHERIHKIGHFNPQNMTACEHVIICEGMLKRFSSLQGIFNHFLNESNFLLLKCFYFQRILVTNCLMMTLFD